MKYLTLLTLATAASAAPFGNLLHHKGHSNSTVAANSTSVAKPCTTGEPFAPLLSAVAEVKSELGEKATLLAPFESALPKATGSLLEKRNDDKHEDKKEKSHKDGKSKEEHKNSKGKSKSKEEGHHKATSTTSSSSSFVPLPTGTGSWKHHPSSGTGLPFPTASPSGSKIYHFPSVSASSS